MQFDQNGTRSLFFYMARRGEAAGGRTREPEFRAWLVVSSVPGL